MFSAEEKQEIAGLLNEAGINCIEAGFPAVSTGELSAVRAVASLGLEATISCLCRAATGDVDAALDADVSTVNIFLGVSDLHMQYKFHEPREKVLTLAMDVVEYAKDHGLFVRFAAEDASRTAMNDLLSVYAACEKSRVDMIGFSDTTGCLIPSETAAVVKNITRYSRLPLSVHCHNDLGCAVANTITAASAGAIQLHTCVNGIGERAGNAALDEVLVILRCKMGIDRYDLSLMPKLSSLVAKASGIRVSKSKPLTGEYAFSHESGIHVAAMLENPKTYEYVPPELLGRQRQFLIGKHSGKKALEYILRDMEVTANAELITKILKEIKVQSEKKCSITFPELQKLIEEQQK
jgi:methanogen homocitrate synthase